MIESFELFSKNIRGSKKGKFHKVRGSKNIQDYHRFYNSYNKKMTIKQFSEIYNCITDNIIIYLQLNTIFKLPYGMGVFSVVDADYYVKFKDGKIKTNRPIDWNKTLRLWHKDLESREDKVLIRSDRKYLTTIYYIKSRALFKDKSKYKFEFTRSLRKQFNIKNYE